MKRIVPLLLALAFPSALHAGSIVGKVAVGTWDTQAEFADLKVVANSGRLSVGNARSGVRFSGGTWSVVNGVLRQTGGGAPALAILGEATWKDYTFTCRARKIGGAEGFLIGFGMADASSRSWANFGGWGNTRHTMECPGVSVPSLVGSIQTGRWYSVRVEVRNNDVRCTLDGVRVFDTARIQDRTELGQRRLQVLGSAGFAQLPSWEQDQLRELLGRSVYLGRAARETFLGMPSFATFGALAASQQIPIIRRINRRRLTWNTGWGFGTDLSRDAAIIQGMDDAVALHNALGVVDRQVVANNSPGTPTADANWDGQIRFGGLMGYRVSLHEIAHTLGAGTYQRWGELMVGGVWQGTYANLQLRSIVSDPNALLHGDAIHFWPYGLNYDSELGSGDDARHTMIVRSLRRDMGLNGVLDTMYTTSVTNGKYRLTPRLATGSAIEAPSGAAGTAISIRAYDGSPGQKFWLEKQVEGTYVIRTSQSGGRCVDLANGDASNGQTIRLWDDNGGAAQRWYLIPMDDGWYKIAPKNGVWKSMDLWGVSSADGTPVKIWDFWDGFGQQFRLDSVP